MRIVSGQFKGRKFHPPIKNWPTRPTTDFAREALFNVLTNHFDFAEIQMLDLFGGTGAHSIEAISRGCNSVVYVDNYIKCHHFVKRLIQEWKIEATIKMVKKDCENFLKFTEDKFDYIFADPPYNQVEWVNIPQKVYERDLLKQNGWLVIEHSHLIDFSNEKGFSACGITVRVISVFSKIKANIDKR